MKHTTKRPLGMRSFGRNLGIALLSLACVLAACGDTGGGAYDPPALSGPRDAQADTTATTDAATPDVVPGDGPCTTTFRFMPPPGKTYFHVDVTGDWNGFANPGVALAGPDGTGAYEAKVALSPGLHAYKLITDGTMTLDPAARRRKYVGGVDNSAVIVRDCKLPSLAVLASKAERPSLGAGTYVAQIAFRPGLGGPLLDEGSLKVSLEHDGAPASGLTAKSDGKGTVTLAAAALKDGKYTAFVEAKDASGSAADRLRLVFWIEAEAFDPRDGTLYMAMNDRLKNGTTANDVPVPPSVDARARFQGGDLQGAKAVVASGALDELGVRTLWFSPFHENAAGAHKADDGVHDVTAYHGYWPTMAREVDARLGGAAALRELVRAAHARGIRVVMDFVVNHVHQDHELFKAHPDWFRTGCTCGSGGCDWTGHRLDCLFAPYLPDVDWSKPEVSDQFVSDAIYWVDAFDLDGLRIDAVKHVEDAAIVNLAGGLRDEFEASGTKLFLTGETAMGWSDCSPPGCPGNDNDYGTIARYVGPTGLDGQFDFVLYHAAAYRTFAWDDRGLGHADYWLRASLSSYPPGALMTPFIGSHDTPRFVTYATYTAPASRGIPEAKWDSVVAAPTSVDPYARHRLALAWLYTIPGVPLLYYGDEYGQWGGADPNNRVFFRDETTLSVDEKATLAFTKKLGRAKTALLPLRRGTYRKLVAEDDWLVFSREVGAEVAFVVLSKSGGTKTVTMPVSLSLPDGTVFHDWLGGADVTVSAGALTVATPARGAAIYATRAP